MENRSIEVKLRTLREMIETGAGDSKARGFIERGSAYWILWCDIMTNITHGRLPLFEVRIRPESIILCVKLTRINYLKLAVEDNGLRRCEPPSFLALLADGVSTQMPQGECRLAPLPREPLHMQPRNPSRRFQGLVGHDNLTVTDETFFACRMTVPNNSNKQRSAVLFNRAVESDNYQAFEISTWQQTWTSVKFITWFVYRWRYVLGLLAGYGGVIALLSTGRRDME